MERFYYYNANPKGRNVGDCIYRAMSLFLGLSWEDTIRLDMDYYLKTGSTFQGYVEKDDYDTSMSGTEVYLQDELGLSPIDKTEYNKYASISAGITAGEFAEKYAKKDTTYIVILPTHITVVKDQMIWDTHDCGNVVIQRAYTM